MVIDMHNLVLNEMPRRLVVRMRMYSVRRHVHTHIYRVSRNCRIILLKVDSWERFNAKVLIYENGEAIIISRL